MYWPGSGREWTEKTLEVAVNKAKAGNHPLVIASNSGATVEKALQLGADPTRTVCVTHMVGFRRPGDDEMSGEMRHVLGNKGVKVLTTTHVLAGVDRALRRQFGGIYPPEIIAHALRMFGQGTKVCVEISVMALDAGMIPVDVPVVAVGGSGRGADTAVLLTPAHSTDLFAVKVHEILAKPHNW